MDRSIVTMDESAPTAVSRRRLSASKLGELLLYHVLPGVFFAMIAINQLDALMRSVTQPPMLADGHATWAYVASIVHRVLNMAFIGLLAVLFAIRRPARKRTKNPVAIIVAFLGTFSSIIVASAPHVTASPWVLTIADLFLVVGTGACVYVLSQLGRNISLTPGARQLVTSGPYGVVRHPLYLAEFVACFGAFLPTFSVLTVVGLAAFVGFQLWRTHYEEQLLCEVFPEYVEYRQRVPRVVPRLFDRAA